MQMATCILFVVIFFVTWMNSYFGWNWYPKSEAELICDGISALMLCLFFVTAAIEGKK